VKTRSRSLDLDENLDFQHREWQVQRIGWWALAVFVLAASLGLFGGGPLSHTAVADPNGALRVEYERFLRMRAPQRLSIRARTTRPGDSEPLQLQISREYFEAMQIDRVLPDPLDVTIGPDDVMLRFPPIATGEVTIVIDSMPLHAGRHRAEIRASNGAVVGIRQFTYF
jgi:hypothetical protein